MGVDTHHLSCGNGNGVAFKPDTEAARLDALRACASVCLLDGEPCTAPDMESVLLLFDMEPAFCLSHSRPYYFDSDLPPGFLPGLAPFIVAQALAPFIEAGCWEAFESDGEAWAIVWDGEKATECGLMPDLPRDRWEPRTT